MKKEIDPVLATSARICDRALLYVYGLNIPPINCLELVLESLQRAQVQSMPLVMDELRKLLFARGILRKDLNSDAPILTSTPPLNRRSMISEK
ncbi:MAG: hypothetical protein AMR96_04540 [Candidatus Adiutrix intracellularis]|jgi:hypothetical protein|nr:MAG: hypothetical protein AMR96_04540 [Candidatus Adiutrix intracellularis]MDR2827017.1 hypothetical protein [Candidatus Adiutrix intracellularis]